MVLPIPLNVTDIRSELSPERTYWEILLVAHALGLKYPHLVLQAENR